MVLTIVLTGQYKIESAVGVSSIMVYMPVVLIGMKSSINRTISLLSRAIILKC